MKRTHHCSWCGKSGATVKQRDCADVLHYFHLACLRAFVAWMRM